VREVARSSRVTPTKKIPAWVFFCIFFQFFIPFSKKSAILDSMKKLFFVLMGLIFFGSTSASAAASSYSAADVATHNTEQDCWMIIDQKVYDLTSYLSQHDREMDIRAWCGTDATEDYNSKAGMNRPHSDKADSDLAGLYLGDLSNANSTPTSGVTSSQTSTATMKETEETTEKEQGGYNLWLPLFATVLLYFLSKFFLKKTQHDFIWNSVILLGLLPSFGFGILMVLGKEFAFFRQFTQGDILFDHVEWSLVFGMSCVLHLLTRLKSYLAEAKITAQHLLPKKQQNF
jgi:cytochrome b involved in lipid metabolism